MKEEQEKGRNWDATSVFCCAVVLGLFSDLRTWQLVVNEEHSTLRDGQ